MRVLDRKPLPRVLFWSFPEEVQSLLAGSFPTVRRIARFEEVRPKEWDLVITSKGDSEVPAGLFVVSFGGTYFDGPTSSSAYGIGRVFLSNSEELILPDGLVPAVEQLVRSDLIPKARNETRLGIAREHRGQAVNLNSTGIEALLLTGERVPLAGWYNRSHGGETWCLPGHADPVLWTRTLLRRWQERYPEQFPRPWPEQAEWLTAEEERAYARREGLQQERQRELARLDRAHADAESELEESARQAAAGPRRLLTEQGDALVEAVAVALESLGFGVERMDTVFPASDRREDLRLRLDARPGWVALVEVRGYSSGGAATSDLLRLERFAKRFERDEGRAPDVVWYVCNQFTNQPPTARPPIFATSRTDVAVFNEDRPLVVVDSRTLFQIWKQALSDPSVGAAAVTRLLTSRGVVE